MSLDFRIAFPCPHFTMEERVLLEDDRRGLALSQPIASSNFVRIMVNDEILIPQGGLSVPAQIEGSISGPFNILPNENTLTVKNSVTAVEGIALPTGLRVPADEVVRIVNNALVAAGADIQIQKLNGRILLTDLIGVGGASRLEVRGDAAAAIGFEDQIGASGKNLYPAWTLDKRQGTTDRFPRFVSRVKANPIFKATYAVPGERCLRCRATFVENDYRFGEDGEPILITNEDLLVQAAQKIVLTEQGSNPFEPWYGTRVHEKVGQKILGAVNLTIQEEVQQALTRFQEMQKKQSTVQTISPEERLFTLLSVNIIEDVLDPTLANVQIVAANASGRPVNLSVVFTTPGAVALAGTLGQPLGIGIG